MRYVKFMLKDSEKKPIPDFEGDGVHCVANDLTEAEMMENRKTADLVAAVFSTVCELLEIRDIMLLTTGQSHSFFKQLSDDGNVQNGIESIELSREKIKKADSHEIAGAIIDLLNRRDKWNKKIHTANL